MGSENNLSQIKKAVSDNLPPTSFVTKVDFEGPRVVIYSKNPSVLASNGELVKELARVIRKRVLVRPDPSVLLEPEKAVEEVHRIVPEDAGVTDVKFDPNFGEALIEAVKPGLVIGKSGKTLNEIKVAIGWQPKVTRTPPIKSKIVESIRHILFTKSDERRDILKKMGKRIYRTQTRPSSWVRISALGGYREVGRSCMYVQTPESKVLIDCGVNVAANNKENGFPYLNVPEFEIQQLDGVVVTHAHLDHCGFIPYLYYMGYTGPVYCTPATRDLMFLLQWDYLDVVEREGKDLPYPRKSIKEMVKYIIPLDYGEVTDISPDVRLTLHNAGHILGSSIAHFHIGDGLCNLAYTGDFKFERSRLFEPANVKFPRLETLIMESTYGSAEDIQVNRRTAEKEMVEVISKTVSSGGKVLIPVFAVGRAQEVMVVLDEYRRTNALPEVPVYLDGMIWEATGIHTTYPEYMNRNLRNQIFHRGRNPFLSEMFERVKGSEMRKDVIEGEPCIVMATSGMLSGGPAIEYLKNFAEDERNMLIFVGYQSEGSLGRRLQKGWKELPVVDNGKTKAIPMNMGVYTVNGFSGHADRNELVNYVRRLHPKPNRILTCHGEESKCVELASVLHRTIKSETSAPRNLEVFRAL